MTPDNKKLFMIKRKKNEYWMRFVISSVRKEMDSGIIKQQI